MQSTISISFPLWGQPGKFCQDLCIGFMQGDVRVRAIKLAIILSREEKQRIQQLGKLSLW